MTSQYSSDLKYIAMTSHIPPATIVLFLADRCHMCREYNLYIFFIGPPLYGSKWSPCGSHHHPGDVPALPRPHQLPGLSSQEVGSRGNRPVLDHACQDGPSAHPAEACACRAAGRIPQAFCCTFKYLPPHFI